MAIVKTNYLHKLISLQSVKGHWYERRGRVWWLSWELSLASINIISGDYKHSMDLFISSGMNLCYTPIFLLDWCCRYTDPANPGCATLRGKFAMIHLQLHNVAEKLKTPGMHRVNVWNCIHKMWCRVSPQSSLDTVSASPRWMLRMLKYENCARWLRVQQWRQAELGAVNLRSGLEIGNTVPDVKMIRIQSSLAVFRCESELLCWWCCYCDCPPPVIFIVRRLSV